MPSMISICRPRSNRGRGAEMLRLFYGLPYGSKFKLPILTRVLTGLRVARVTAPPLAHPMGEHLHPVRSRQFAIDLKTVFRLSLCSAQTVFNPMKYRWSLAPPQPALASSLASELKIYPLLAQCLLNRGFSEPETIL